MSLSASANSSWESAFESGVRDSESPPGETVTRTRRGTRRHPCQCLGAEAASHRHCHCHGASLSEWGFGHRRWRGPAWPVAPALQQARSRPVAATEDHAGHMARRRPRRRPTRSPRRELRAPSPSRSESLTALSDPNDDGGARRRRGDVSPPPRGRGLKAAALKART